MARFKLDGINVDVLDEMCKEQMVGEAIGYEGRGKNIKITTGACQEFCV